MPIDEETRKAHHIIILYANAPEEVIRFATRIGTERTAVAIVMVKQLSKKRKLYKNFDHIVVNGSSALELS